MRVNFIAFLISTIEKFLFFPKLCKILKYEPHLCRANSKRKLMILDIGAHVGESIYFYKKIFHNPVIHSFEPCPTTFKKLRNLSSADVHTHNYALAEKVGESIFFVSKLSSTSTLILPNTDSKYHKYKAKILKIDSNKMYRSITVKCTTVDEFCKQMEIVDLLKIDVEGSELDVLLGASFSLQTGKIKVIQFERHSNDLRKDNSNLIHNLLTSFNFVEFSTIKHPFLDVYELIYHQSNK